MKTHREFPLFWRPLRSRGFLDENPIVLRIANGSRFREFLEELLDDHARRGVQQPLTDRGDGAAHLYIALILDLGLKLRGLVEL